MMYKYLLLCLISFCASCQVNTGAQKCGDLELTLSTNYQSSLPIFIDQTNSYSCELTSVNKDSPDITVMYSPLNLPNNKKATSDMDDILSAFYVNERNKYHRNIYVNKISDTEVYCFNENGINEGQVNSECYFIKGNNKFNITFSNIDIKNFDLVTLLKKVELINN
ncbi:hypothetical protein [Kangiella sp. HZ709]|uniref:hypothetical protein n=1 Tax=Kangiella sp. HZ709 TaxID=2666328 RepID=UPI0012B10400|nr:hypothetical protein [Kangiella sp. HZ709]MRX27038.1 hypothetical protein [Kangiella sp. HZ709]